MALQLVFWTKQPKSDILKVYQAIRSGNIDAADMALPNLIDDIVLTMKKHGLLDMLSYALPDKRRDNHHIPLDILLALAVTAKLKIKTSLTDVPFAVNDAELLAELGWNVWDSERDLNEGLFSESVMRKLLLKYTSEDIIINDRGFLSREILNYLKTERKVNTYIPAKENRIIFEDAVNLAKKAGKWQKHPNKKRKDQEIQLVTDLGPLWQNDKPEQDVPVNACVVHDKKTEYYFVFMITDTERTARQIINTYELRPEIEEDFRQMKDFWKLTDFKSTQYNYITYHIVMTLTGYLYFQLYKNMEEGRAFIGKSLPVVIKNYKETRPKSVVIYSGQYFGIFPFLEFLQLYAECTLEVRQHLDPILAKV